jgi:uncharacterized membrane protein
MQKNIFKNLRVIIFFIALCSPSIVFAETINSFHSDINVSTDNILSIQETIHYDFGYEYRHGIFRDIPETFNHNTKILSVTDEKGISYLYNTSHTYNQTSVKIGDPDSTITGENTYVITYEVEQEISFFETHDELYWNVNGTEWAIPSGVVSATVTFPTEIDPSELDATCYAGWFGATTQNCTYEYSTENNQTIFTFKSNEDLYAYENLTIVAQVPKNIIQEPLPPTFKEKIMDEWWLILLALFLTYKTIEIWKTHGDDPRKRIPVVAQYAPPENLSAAEMDMLLTERLSAKSLTATIFELGTMGMLKIQSNDKKHNKRNLIFIDEGTKKQKKLTEFQNYIYEKIFSTNKPTRKLSDLKYRFSNFKYANESKIKEKLKSKKYYHSKPFNKYFYLLLIGGMLQLAAGFVLFLFSVDAIYTRLFFIDWAHFFLFFGGITTFILAFFMTKKTQAGVDITQQIKGFKLYLKVAEKDRIKFHNPPAKTIELFEKLLPYAVVLGVEKKWTNSFKHLIEEMMIDDIYARNYLYLHTNNIQKFSSALKTMSKHINAQTTMSRSSGHSSSGGGGGGFSGGGGGGGGGGSW